MTMMVQHSFEPVRGSDTVPPRGLAIGAARTPPRHLSHA